MVSRGVRNCNPGNIRLTNGLTFVGQVSKSSDKSFKQFVSMTYGVRALMKLLETYYLKYHLTTVSAIISRYAPSVENRTDDYINFVCRYMHTKPSTGLRLYIKLDLFPLVETICPDLFPLVEAICKYESGYVPTESMLIDAFLKL